MAMPALVPHYTAREIRAFPDHRVRYEVIRGELFVTPAPGWRHQQAVLEVATVLRDYLERTGLGMVAVAPFEVELTPDSAVQPDVLVVLAKRESRFTPARLYGPPSLVVEVVSYSSKRTDRLQKRQLYQDEGVPQYWIVDVEARRVERWRPRDAEPEVLSLRLDWRPHPGSPALEIDLVQLFDRVCREP
jgi:Uma2 family endonuclease